MASTLKNLSARVTALEKSVAKFIKSESSGAKRAKPAGRKSTKQKAPARKKRVRPPTVEQLVHSGMPDFVTPMDKL